MNRKEFGGYAKKYGIAVLCALPVLIVLDVVLLQKLGGAWTIVIDCLIILLFFALALVISRAWQNHVTKKRTEFLNRAEQQMRENLLSQQQTSEPQPQSTKIWQKQKKAYKSVKRKK